MNCINPNCNCMTKISSTLSFTTNQVRKLKKPDRNLLKFVKILPFEDSLLILPCKWNFRTLANHCNLVIGYCPSAFEEGVAKILHGNSGSFHSGKLEQEYFVYWYEAFQKVIELSKSLKDKRRRSWPLFPQMKIRKSQIDFSLW
jgi:hypothetical protein